MNTEIENTGYKHIHTIDSSDEYGERISFFSRNVWKKALKYLVPVIVFAVFAGVLFYHNIKQTRLNFFQTEQRSSVLIGSSILFDDISGFIHDIKYYNEIIKTRNLFDASGTINPQIKDELTEIFLRSLDAYKRYDKIRILDINGMELLRVNYHSSGSTVVPDADLQNIGDHYYFTETIKLDPGETFVSMMDLNMEHDQVELPIKPMIRISTPIKNATGQNVGIIVLNYYANILLDHIRLLNSDFYTQELTLLNSQGYWLLGAEADKEWGFIYPDRKSEIFGNYDPAVWEEILAQDQGTILTPNGSFSFAKIYPPEIEGVNFIDGANEYFWVMVSRIPAHVLSAANFKSLLKIFVIHFFIVGLIVVIIILNTRSRYMLDANNTRLLANNEKIQKLYSELAINEERGRLAIEGSGDGVWDWWIQTGEMKFSKLYMEMLGYEENELPSHINTWVESVHPEDYPRAEEKLKDYFEERIPEHAIELRLRCKDNRYKWILCRGAVVERDKDRNPARMIGIHSDITERKQLEEEINLSRENEKRANAAKSEFLSNMSHEIRTPLNAIVGFTDLTLKTSLTPQQSNYLSKIKASSGILLGIIGDILDISKLEADKVKLEIAHFEIEELLHNVTTQISTICQEKGLELIINIADDVPVSFKGDSLRLGQVLSNLVGNAIKFTDEGEISINVKLLKNGGSTAVLQFSVRDKGIGLTEEQTENLFQPFNQAETSTTRMYGGTGLGLAISRNLVRLMDGEIWVESEIGKGSTFFFTVRLENEGEKRLGKFKNAFKMWNMKVLVVDDSLESREVIKGTLTSMSFDVTTCSTGEEAISIIQTEADTLRYDLVIMDWKMPEMDGIEASRRIKQLFSPHDAPVIIILTAYNSPIVLAEARRLGVETVLYKPVMPSLLLNSIMQAFGKEEFAQTNMSVDEVFAPNYLEQLRGIRILLVEDNQINQEVAQEILEQVGMTVVIAGNGKEAVEMVNSGTYDVVLMDVQMPIMNGYDATRVIRNNPVFSEMPIIAMTANSLKGEKEKCIQAGMNDYISKPMDTTLLFQTIINQLTDTQKSRLDREPLEEIKKDETLLKEDSSAMPSLNGFDVQLALGRLGGNLNLYRKLLVQFRKNHHNDIKTIRQALELGDIETAERIIHTIKGAAGNIGAQVVYTASVAFETVTEFTLEYVEPLLGQLEKALELVFTSIAFLEEKRQKKTNSEHAENIGQLVPSLEELAKLLHDNDLAATEFLENIVGRYENTSFSNKLAQIGSFVDQFDYDEALKVLDETIGIIKEGEINEREPKQ